jgi:regulator of sigma E protease
MISILLGLIGLGLMVFIHELGHFVAAKMNGVEVETFALGWGPRLVGFTYRGTRYQISWFPIGGYCKMKGELVPGIAGGAGEKAEEAANVKGSFLAAAPWRRIVIAAFGPLFNLLFALIVSAFIWGIGFPVSSPDNRVILATDYSLDAFRTPPPAQVAGLKTGDRILAIDGAPVEKFQDILEKVSVDPGRKFTFTVERLENGAPRTLTLGMAPELDKNTGTGRIGIYAWYDPVIDSVAPGSAAAIAGLRKGDTIVMAGNRKVLNAMDLSAELATQPERLLVTYQRAGKDESVPLALAYDKKGSPNLGIAFASRIWHTPRLGIGPALQKSADETWKTVTLTVRGIGLLFKGIKLGNAVAGPLRITYYIGQVATSGFQLGFGAGIADSFRFLAFLSVVLFLMNLLPIPAMDGGQIILFLVEIARGKPVRSRLIWRLQMIGFTILIVLLVLVTFSDILFFGGR